MGEWSFETKKEDDSLFVRRTGGFPSSDSDLSLDATIYVHNIPRDASHQSLSSLFSPYGAVIYVRFLNFFFLFHFHFHFMTHVLSIVSQKIHSHKTIKGMLLLSSLLVKMQTNSLIHGNSRKGMIPWSYFLNVHGLPVRKMLPLCLFFLCFFFVFYFLN